MSAKAMIIDIPVTEEWHHMYRPRCSRPFQRRSGQDDFIVFSEPYTEYCGEPVWFYSWGNSTWLRCPIGIPGDILNDAGDRISAVEIVRSRGSWVFRVSIEERT